MQRYSKVLAAERRESVRRDSRDSSWRMRKERRKEGVLEVQGVEEDDGDESWSSPWSWS